jgi:SAM-dependent methyltransferase
MKTLTSFLNLRPQAEILDLACGRGRHSIYLNKLGFIVTGVDLSSKSIEFAKVFETDTLIFKEYDMSKVYPKKFDAVFNLFTSFGYFENEEDNLNTIRSIKKELNEEGVGVIDFLNVEYVQKNLVAFETKIIDEIKFYIKRSIKNGYIYKEINFKYDDQDYTYTEKVKALSLNDFKNYFKKAGINLLFTFGDYQLNKYQPENSSRLILIFN